MLGKNAQDVGGERFGRLVVQEPTGERRHRSVVWRCLCDCGRSKLAIITDLRSGAVRSCGCLRREKSAETQRAKTVAPDMRFWRFVRVAPGCWEWSGGKDRDGYGRFTLAHHVPVPAHRYSYELMHGAIAEGLTIDHLCRNRGCVNPLHLEPVTNAENIRRGYAARGGRRRL